MVGELEAAFEWLQAQEGIDQTRIGVSGISMGATLGYWLAAIEPRRAAVAHLCCFTDFSELIRTGAHDLHRIYLAVPGLLTVTSNGEIAGQITPRRQSVEIGDQDPLTTAPAVGPALIELRTTYVDRPKNLTICRSPATGHQETSGICRAFFEFFKTL